MKPGPPPKPSRLHLVDGNPSKLPAHKLRDGVEPDIVLPDPPACLSDEAKAEWARLGGEMIRLGLISNIDRAAFAVCCEHWATWCTAQIELQKVGPAGLVTVTPSGYAQMSVWLQVRNRAAEGLRQYLHEFGMTPSARTQFNGMSPQMQLFPTPDAGQETRAEAASPAARHFTA